MFLHLPKEVSDKNHRHYSKYIEYRGEKEPKKKIEKGLAEITNQIFKDY